MPGLNTRASSATARGKCFGKGAFCASPAIKER
jgi:hypothetical protein